MDGIWNSFKNLIKKEEISINKKYLTESFNNFVLHYNEPRKAIIKDIENIKKCKTPPYERDFIWLFFLGIIPFKNPANWQKIITEERAKYLTLKNKYFTNDIIDFVNLKRINDTFKYDGYKKILSKEEFDLLNLIKVDVDRTYQENEIFQKEEIKKKLIYVLYVYAKEHPKYGYRQGMSDVCGVFLYVLYKNYIMDDNFEKDKLSCTYSVIHSNNCFLEHDLYLLYSKFMNKGVSEFFLYNSKEYKNSFLSSKTIDQKLALTVSDIYKSNDSELKKRVYILYYKRFQKIDMEFSQMLIRDIEPELFLTRWYLCAFTREFKLEQIVYLWDLIIMYEFVESKLYKNKKLLFHLNFMDCIALSMLLNCKPDIVKKEDINDLMTSIMHYPTNITIEKIIKIALDIYSKLNPEINL